MYKDNVSPSSFLLSTIKLLLILLLAPCLIKAQSSNAFEKAGDKAFAKGDYYNAAFYFDQALEGSEDNLELTYKKAESQRLFNDYAHAAVTYSRVVSDDKKRMYPNAVFYLAEMKKYNGMYETAKVYFKLYATLHKDNDYFGKKALLEIGACDSALKLSTRPVKATVMNMGSNVNTIHSDFAGIMLNNTDLYYSSNRFEAKDPDHKGNTIFLSKILNSKQKINRYTEAEPITETINVENKNISNAAISPDKKIMVFCQCIPDSVSKLQCKLYESFYTDKQWSAGNLINIPNINDEGYTYTQPTLSTNGNAGYVLYFASNMPGGYGKMDIYKSNISVSGIVEEPQNCGPVINTFGDDITPFYSKGEEALYFSSEGLPGLGGFDIFRSNNRSGTFETPLNIGVPLNTSYNDIYFTVNDNDTTGVLTSNRKGAMHLTTETCCYDLFSYKMSKKEKKKVTGEVEKTFSEITLDDSPMSTRDSLTKSLIENELEFTFPLSLYFDNDEPDPRTMKTTTKSDYFLLYENYLKTENDYKKNYANGFAKDLRPEAEKRVDAFFENDVVAGYNRLDKMCDYILSLLLKNKKVTLTVRGLSSPLADYKYNFRLSQRRISCFINTLNAYQNGVLKGYINSSDLQIIEEVQGEEDPKIVSDDVFNKQQSVYSPTAAKARRIEVTSLSVK